MMGNLAGGGEAVKVVRCPSCSSSTSLEDLAGDFVAHAHGKCRVCGAVLVARTLGCGAYSVRSDVDQVDAGELEREIGRQELLECPCCSTRLGSADAIVGAVLEAGHMGCPGCGELLGVALGELGVSWLADWPDRDVELLERVSAERTS